MLRCELFLNRHAGSQLTEFASTTRFDNTSDSDPPQWLCRRKERPSRVQDTVDLWLAQGRDLNLPFRHYEPMQEQANSVAPTSKHE